MLNEMNVKVFINGVENNNIKFATSKIQNLRVYGGENEIQDTKLNWYTIESYDVTCDGIVLNLTK